MSECPEDQIKALEVSSSKLIVVIKSPRIQNKATAYVTSEKWSSCVPQRKVQHGFKPLREGVNAHLHYTSAGLSGTEPIAVSVPLSVV